jgi:pheromone shutdown protein TraB
VRDYGLTAVAPSPRCSAPGATAVAAVTGTAVAAVEQGQAVGAKILLGDRPVNVTLQHLAEAIRGTGVRRLLTVQLSPEDVDPALLQGMDDTSNKESITAMMVREAAAVIALAGDASFCSWSMFASVRSLVVACMFGACVAAIIFSTLPTQNCSNVRVCHQIFSLKWHILCASLYFCCTAQELMKKRETVDKLMAVMKRELPLVYNAMVAERDAYSECHPNVIWVVHALT